MSKLVQIAVVLLSLLGGGSEKALAHASLLFSSPPDGAVVASAPSELVLRFNEPVSVTSLRLTPSDHSQLDLRADVRDNHLVVPLPALPLGNQVVSYRVISADGHPVSGSIVFSIGAASGTAEQSTAASAPLALAIWVTRFAVYLGLLGATGGAFFVNWIAAPHQTLGRTIFGLRVVAVVGVVASTLSIGLQGLDMLGESFKALVHWRAWASALQSSLGPSVMIGTAACLCAFRSLTSKPTSSGRVLSGMALLGTGLAFSLTGHASSADPQWLMRFAVVLHGATAAYWVGSLWPLASAVQAGGAHSLQTVLRFSRGALYAVSVLVAAGTVMSVVKIGNWSALTETAYGNLWLAKLSAVVLMLGLAGVNRVRLTPALALSPKASKHLVLSIALEIAISLLVLGIVAGWRFTPPPRTSVAVTAPAIHVHLHGLKAMAEVELRPGQAGPVDVSATVLSGEFEPLVPQELTFFFKNSNAGIEPIQKTATRTTEGKWVVKGLVLPLPGQWTVRAELLISDFEKEIVEADVAIP